MLSHTTNLHVLSNPYTVTLGLAWESDLSTACEALVPETETAARAFQPERERQYVVYSTFVPVNGNTASGICGKRTMEDRARGRSPLRNRKLFRRAWRYCVVWNHVSDPICPGGRVGEAGLDIRQQLTLPRLSQVHSVPMTPFYLGLHKEYFDCIQRDSHAEHYI